MPDPIEPRFLGGAIETSSTDPCHLADRHIEEADALMTILETLASNSEPQQWMSLQQGILLNSRRIRQRLADAREALDQV